jgi:N-methylhydantoinase B
VARSVIERTSGEREEIAHSLHRVALAPGDTIDILTAGGGGWGDPRARDPARIREDLRLGYVTAARAAADERGNMTAERAADHEEEG